MPENDPGLQAGSVEPEASQVQVQGRAAKELARVTASEAVAKLPGRIEPVDPAAWTVNCDYDSPDLVRCEVSTARCTGEVRITPTKVPAGQSAQGLLPKAEASSMTCVRAKRPAGD